MSTVGVRRLRWPRAPIPDVVEPPPPAEPTAPTALVVTIHNAARHRRAHCYVSRALHVDVSDAGRPGEELTLVGHTDGGHVVTVAVDVSALFSEFEAWRATTRDGRR